MLPLKIWNLRGFYDALVSSDYFRKAILDVLQFQHLRSAKPKANLSVRSDILTKKVIIHSHNKVILRKRNQLKTAASRTKEYLLNMEDL